MAAKRERYAATPTATGAPSTTTEHPPVDEGVINAKRAARRVAAKGAATNVRSYGHRVMRINQKPKPAE